MCEKLDALFNERNLIYAFECVSDGAMKITYAAKKHNMTVPQFKQAMREKGFSVPVKKPRHSASAN